MSVLDEAAQLAEKDQRDEALAKLLPFMDDNPDDPRALFIAGYIFMKSDRAGLANNVFRRAADLNPGEPVIWHNLGKTYHECQRDEDAERCFRRAIKLKPDYAPSLEGLALVNLNRAEYGMAIEYANRAIRADPKTAEAYINRGMANLALRNWKEGWADYNLNVGTDGNRKELVYGSETRWKGEKGKVVACYGEQGIGDEISFGSCLPDLIRDSKKVVIECDGRLKHLFRRSFPTCDVYGSRYEKGRKPWYDKYQFDHRAAVGELPEHYRASEEAFPAGAYLIPNPEIALQWRALFASLGPEPKVGIAWSGGKKQTGSKKRSVTLETLLPILKNKAHFVSLQYQDPSEDIEAFEAKHGIKIHHWPHGVQTYDYDVTAALISELDLVISVTTTAIHCAGALGKETWCLVPEKPMWRYMTKGEDFPWAKSVTLYRQKGREWPIHTLAAKLRERCG